MVRLVALDLPLFGGAEEDRTPDLRIANATLSQLSYGPVEAGTILPEHGDFSMPAGIPQVG